MKKLLILSFLHSFINNMEELQQILTKYNARLVAVSKMKTPKEILNVYHQGQRIFGENRVQELIQKKEVLPDDIEWHMIGHLQSNKVKMIAPFIALVHSVDSLKLLNEIEKQGERFGRIIPCLLQVKIATEETKYGLNTEQLEDSIRRYKAGLFRHVRIVGLMGMASFSTSKEQVRKEFQSLRKHFDRLKTKFDLDDDFTELSMGMSGDYEMALEEGSTMVRIGSLIFGARSYT